MTARLVGFVIIDIIIRQYNAEKSVELKKKLVQFMLQTVREHTGVRNDSATNLARAFSYPDGQNCASKRERRYLGGRLIVYEGKGVHTKSFISDISLSTSSMNCMMKSTSLCFSISSV